MKSILKNMWKGVILLKASGSEITNLTIHKHLEYVHHAFLTMQYVSYTEAEK